jgi:hypothetical protein
MAKVPGHIVRQKSGLLGPFALSAESIAEHIEPLSIGTYAVGRLREGRFFVRKIGRDDRDLAAALTALIGAYDAFKFRSYVSTRRAFEKECQLFHAFAPPDTTTHPVRPPGTRFVCPVTDCAESGEPWGGAPGKEQIGPSLTNGRG